MSMKEQSWYPYASGAAWGLLVLALVLVNSGSIVLAVVLGAVVAVLSWKLAQHQRDASGPG